MLHRFFLYFLILTTFYPSYGQIGEKLPSGYDTTDLLKILKPPLQEDSLPTDAYYSAVGIQYSDYQNYRLAEVVWTPNFCSSFFTDCLLLQKTSTHWEIVYAERVTGYGLGGEVKLLLQWQAQQLTIDQVVTNGTVRVTIPLSNSIAEHSIQRSATIKWVVVISTDKKLKGAIHEQQKAQKKNVTWWIWILEKPKKYHTLIEFDTKELAEKHLDSIKNYFPTAYITDANKLCNQIDYAYSYKAGEATVLCYD
jgi:hypothetical protein